MAKPSLGNLNTTQTFQNWFDKTNEIVSLLKSDVVTASTAGAGDTTDGSAAITGTFTAATVIGSTLVKADDIAPNTETVVNFQSPITVTSNAKAAATFNFGSGGQVNFTDGSLTWAAGIESSNPGNFVIDTGTSPTKFQLSPAGTLTVPDAVVTGNLTVGTITIGGGGSGLTTDDVSEGSTNLYFTQARARASFSGGDGINISSTGVISFDGEGELSTYTGNQFIATPSVGTGIKAYMSGFQQSGVPIGYLQVDYGGSTYTPLSWNNAGITVSGTITTSGGSGIASDGDVDIDGDLTIKDGSTPKIGLYQSTGNIVAVGDITTNGSVSDERLKENVVRINNAIDKVSQINGYTFNYKDRPDETLPGVLAQEIEKVLPEVVYEFEQEHEENSEHYKAVRYAHIVPLLIEAIKDLKGKVDDLQDQINKS